MSDFRLRPDRRALLVAGGALALPSVARAGDPRAYDDQLDLVFSRAGVPALAGMIVGRSGASWTGVKGVRRLGSTEAATAQDAWHLGSNTKAMTAALWARTVQAGKARWDMPVSEVFPDVTAHERMAAVTVDDLLRHRGGLSDATLLTREWLMTARADPRSLAEQRAALAAASLTTAPAGRQGAFAYGNINYIVAGAALERLHGRAWEDLMRDDLFAPLGITTGGFGAPTGVAPWGHVVTPTGPVAISPGPLADNPAALGPAGTAHMSLGDYARFLSVFMDYGKDWLTRESLGHLTQAYAGPPPGYACGWGVVSLPWGGRNGQPGTVLTHDGSNTFWRVSAAVAPDRGLAVVTACNDAGRGEEATGELMMRLIRAATA